MPLPDILQFIGLGGKTGVLTVERGLRRKQLAFEKGQAVFCSSGNAKEYLGQHLLARTSLTEEDLADALREHEESGRRLGEVLVDRGLITEEDLQTVLSRKIADSMYDLFTWPEGTFSFAEGAVPVEVAPVRFPVGWQDVLMEGARRADELSVIREVLPGPHVRLRSCPERFPPGFPRTGGDRKLIQLIDEGLTLGQLCPRFHVSDFDIQSRLATLVRQGVLEVDGDTAGDDPETDRDRALEAASSMSEHGRHADALEHLARAAAVMPGDPQIADAVRRVEVALRKQFRDEHGGLEAVPRLAVPLEEITAVSLDSRQAFVISRVNGQWSVASIAQICPFDEVEVLATLDRLHRRGFVSLAPQPAATA